MTNVTFLHRWWFPTRVKCSRVIAVALILAVVFFTNLEILYSDIDLEADRFPERPMLRPKAPSPLIDPVTFFADNPQKNNSIEQREVKEILFLNPTQWIRYRNSIVNFRRCKYSNCMLHEDINRSRDSSAILYFLDEPFYRSPPVPLKYRRQNQPWVFFSVDPPTLLHSRNSRFDSMQNAYNWSWNYRLDADIFNPHGFLQTKVNDTTANIAKNYTAIYRRKTKLAAWLVSTCRTPGRREDYVRQLQRYVDVDVYGACAGKRIEGESFKKLLSTKYKFYLGFENSICKDYITKFFLFSTLDLVVVVRGGADYSSLLPHGTYVDSANFTSVKELADFLIRLGSNEEEYISYLRRKDGYTVVDRDTTYHNGMCQLCEKLNHLERNRKMYSSSLRYIYKGQCRRPTDIE